MHALGIVINPKLNEPVLVAVEGDGDVGIFSLRTGVRIGTGSYERDDPDYLRPAEVTGFPRVHTPAGVKPKGKGYGTCLYTGLCVGAHMNAENEIDIRTDQDGDGISSESESRSVSADAWWNRAVELRLADRETTEVTEEDLEFGYDDLSDCEDGEGRKVTISQAIGDVTTEVEVDTYVFSTAESANLVLVTMAIEFRPSPSRLDMSGSLKALWKTIVEDEGYGIEEIDTEAILAADVRNLSADAVNLFTAIMSAEGVDDEDIDALRLRAELGLDPSVPIRQMHLPFTPNPAERSELHELNEQTEELRDRVGWSRLASLP